MKKVMYSLMVLFVLSISISAVNTAISNPQGAPAGKTGSPGDGGATCQASGCHSGTPTFVAGIISSNAPVEGYTPGTTYTITVTTTGSGNKGLEVSPQDLSGNLLGTMIAGTGTKLLGGGKYLTHTTPKTGSSATWTFQWKAPAAGTGDVTFYGAFAITDKSTKKSTLVIKEAVATALAPTLVAFSPTSAIVGATLTLNGTDFTDATSVSIGGTNATSFTVVSDSVITVVVPNGAISGDVIVTNAVGSSTLSGFTMLFAPNVASFIPTSARINDTIIINGANFDNVLSVSIGGVPAKSYTRMTSSILRAVVDSCASGIVEITTIAGTSSLAGFVFIPTLVGIQFNQNKLVRVYPNPTSDVLYIQNKGLDKVQKVEIYNLKGQLVFVSKSANAIDITSLSAGKYIVLISTNKSTYRETVLVN